ncbi:hypothetical protein LO772_09090 [Yinghuangia sp. ASG 101]|uniref:hypothetical protein n=1 Tax=Yinghuangia sp. ASG 101 TaxID=2896848 RepID=UPI001E5895D4|nr:hypothetical protein [Yinghuangia sp. ASG 101]UGQ13733.1 hypothetical protein LO772_09090 [Yinghuangia sp. ASG 101]
MRRVVRGARTTPGRWALIGVLLAVSTVLVGGFTFASVRERADAADRVATTSEPMGLRTQELYRALAQANASAAASLLEGGVETNAVREDYETSLDNAQLILQSVASAEATGNVRTLLSQLFVGIPRYREDVARAKTQARQGSSLGAAYLTAASRQMEQEILPAAVKLHDVASARLRADHREATSVPWAAIAVGAGSLTVLVAAQVLLARRTKRVFNPGLIVATVSVAALAGWTAFGLGTAYDALARSRDDGWRPLNVVADAQLSLLQARAAESQILVQNGTESTRYIEQLQGHFGDLTGDTVVLAGDAERSADPPAAPRKQELAVAAALSAGDSATAPRIAEAREAVAAWIAADREVMAKYNAADFSTAVGMVIRPDGAAQMAFRRAEQALTDVITEDQRDFRRAVDDARQATDGLAVGGIVLAAVATVGVVDGVARRVGEYR